MQQSIEQSMAETVKNIQRVAEQVSGGAEQIGVRLLPIVNSRGIVPNELSEFLAEPQNIPLIRLRQILRQDRTVADAGRNQENVSLLQLVALGAYQIFRAAGIPAAAWGQLLPVRHPAAADFRKGDDLEGLSHGCGGGKGRLF